jgi:hypothetical protein
LFLWPVTLTLSLRILIVSAINVSDVRNLLHAGHRARVQYHGYAVVTIADTNISRNNDYTPLAVGSVSITSGNAQLHF